MSEPAEEEKSPRIVNTQIKVDEALHQQFKEMAEFRDQSIQAAGHEAISFWVEIQKAIASSPKENPEQLSQELFMRVTAAIEQWAATRRQSKFDTDPLFKLVGIASGSSNLSRTHDRYQSNAEER